MRSIVLDMLLAIHFCAVSPAQQLPFRTYRGENGLIHSSIRTIAQDREGFMWFGASDGLSRYDGASFTTLLAPGGLVANFINEIYIDTLNRLWIATNFNGITRYNGSTFTSYYVLPDSPSSATNRINTLLQLPDGALLVGTDAGAFRFSESKSQPLFAGSHLPRLHILKIHRDRKGTIWIATSNGLFTSEPPLYTSCVPVQGFEHRTVYSVAEDTLGNLWFASDRGLARINQHSGLGPLPRVMAHLATEPARSLLWTRSGSLWIGTPSSGAYELTRTGVLQHFTVENGLAGNRIVNMFEDREGILWFATNAGVNKLVHTNMANYFLSEKLLYNYVGAILATDGAMWFGTPFGLSKWSGGRYTSFSTANGLSSNYILSLLQDSQRNVWIGTNRGINRLVSGERFVAVRDGSQRTDRIARFMFEDREKRVWVGRATGLTLYTEDRFRHFMLPETAGLDRLVLTILEDTTGRLWVGTQECGIFRLEVEGNGTKVKVRPTLHLLQRDGLPDQHIRTGMVDREGNLWFGTRFSGVFKIVLSAGDVHVVRPYSTREGLSGDWVRDILQDKRGDIWVATNRGVDRLHATTEGKYNITTLTFADGLAGDEAFDLYEDPHGYIWFGLSNGATRYFPLSRSLTGSPPPVYITGFQVFGQEDSLALRSDHANLSYSQHSVAFEFIGVSFRDEARMQYQFMLEGFDPRWGEWTTRRYANYTHLPSGTYTFRVRAKNGSGAESAVPATFTFIIAKPVWETWWFLSLIAALTAGIVYGLHRMRVNRLLEAERVRTRIAADLHDDIGSTLSSIAIFSQLAREETEAASPKTAALVRRIGESAHTMLESLDDIVWSINPENDSLENIALRMRQCASELFEGKGLDFTLHIPQENLHTTLPMEKRRHLYLIFKEATNNIIKHASCSYAFISFLVGEHGVELIVKDNGRGISQNGTRPGNGLKNMERRAAAVGGRLMVESEENKGTTVTFTLKV